ncbi:MAG: glycosyltransferase family 39 protein [Planctomycetaceae bacterium]|nr:glycosyltransferase family 39 protein [Planctomycetaceae bacterium]
MTRRELVILATVLAAGVALRLFALSQSAVEHFDEGAYASNIYFGPPDYAFPQQQLYAPPLLPALIEGGMIAGLPPNLAALLPSFLAGVMTIAAVWWFGRSWFGPEVGIAAAALVALSDFHIAFSTTALTDVLLGLWIILAVDAIARSLFGGDFRWAIGAGLYTGLAWWTKYNGWLPLAIEAAGLVVMWIFLRPPRRTLQTWLACFAVTALVAAAVWAPYLYSLQAHGGYAPIAANHARYVVGFTGWLGSAGRQISNQFAIGMGLSMLGLVLAMFLPTLLEPRGFRQALRQLGNSVIGAIAALMIFGLFPMAFGAAIAIARLIVAWYQAPRIDARWQRRMIGLSLVFAWWGGMLVATPFYTPYARLTLPLLMASWLAAAANWTDCLHVEEHRPRASERARKIFGCLTCGLMLGMVIVIFPLCLPHDDHFDNRGDRRALIRIAQQIRDANSSSPTRAIYVFGEPALFFQLRAAGEPVVVPIQGVPATPAAIAGKPIPTLLLVGPHAQRDPDFQRQMAAAKDRWKLFREFDYQPSTLVWLDMNDPRRSPRETADLDRVRLHRLKE